MIAAGTFERPELTIGSSNHYFLMTRFMFAFMIIALFFGVVSWFTGFASMCVRIGGWLSGFLVHLALFFQTLVTTLMT